MTRIALAVLIALVFVLGGCRRAPVDNLLEELAPVESRGVKRATLVTDGLAAREGDGWKSHRAAVFDSTNAALTYDLGRSIPLRAAWLQADNNDNYELSVSEDGRAYRPLWLAPSTGGSGLRARYSTELDGRGRYLRLKPDSGDSNLSVSELRVYEQAPAAFPPRVPRGASQPPELLLRNKTLLLGLSLIGFALLAFKRLPWWWLLPISLLPVAAAVDFAQVLADAWPPASREVSLVRGTVAAVAAAVVVLEAFAARRLEPRAGAVAAVLGICGVGAVLAFYNLGHPQFYDQKLATWTPVHHLDLRQYHGTAKYFPEIGYFALYDADVAAYAEDQNLTLESIASQPMRNLYTNKITTVGARTAEITAVKRRFSAERWQEYVRDARHFRETMGTSHWLETMIDLGGNATPVWIAIAHLLFSTFEASNRSFLITGLFDPLLLLAMFGAIGRCFGWRAMFVCMTIFGANDFIMYGTNWGGATLRHDWLAYLGLGACALKRERWLLGGALFALAASIRAFPALALIGAALPAVWWLGEHVYRERRLPSLRTLRTAQQPLLRIAVGAAVTLAVLLVFSSVVVKPQAWSSWLTKVSLLDADSHVNPVSLRTLISGSDHDREWLFTTRMPLFIAVAAALGGLLFVVCRGKRLEQAAMFGLMLLPIFLYPANYYLHLVCLLPLAVNVSPRGRPEQAADTWSWALLLGMCAVQYFTVLVGDLRVHFYLASFLLMATLSAALIVLTRRDFPALVHDLRQAALERRARRITPPSPAVDEPVEDAPADGVPHTASR